MIERIRYAILKKFSPRLAQLERIKTRDVSWMRSVSSVRNIPFNGDDQRTSMVEQLIKAIQFDHAIETGTWVGNTTQWLAKNFRAVTSIEIDPGYHGLSIIRLSHFNNLDLVMGSSEDVIPKLCAQFPDQRFFAYLDAHDRPDVPPLHTELRALAQHGNTVALIDDFRIPGAKFGFGTYSGRPLDCAFIKPALPEGTRIYGPSYPCADGARGWALLGLGAAAGPVDEFAQAMGLTRIDQD